MKKATKKQTRKEKNAFVRMDPRVLNLARVEAKRRGMFLSVLVSKAVEKEVGGK